MLIDSLISISKVIKVIASDPFGSERHNPWQTATTNYFPYWSLITDLYSFCCNITVNLSTAVKYNNPACCTNEAKSFMFKKNGKNYIEAQIFLVDIKVTFMFSHQVTSWTTFCFSKAHWIKLTLQVSSEVLSTDAHCFFLPLPPQNTRSYLHSSVPWWVLSSRNLLRSHLFINYQHSAKCICTRI